MSIDSLHEEEDITIINIYTPDKRPKVYETKIDRIKGRNSSTVIVECFPCPTFYNGLNN